MRILFVGLSNSIHTARWIAQFSALGWDLHLFDSLHGLIHPELRGVEVHAGWRKPFDSAAVRLWTRWPFSRGRHWFGARFPKIWNLIVPESSKFLAKIIKRIHPDCIHSLGIQVGGYAVLEAHEMLRRFGIPWIVSSWGSDVYYHGTSEEHAHMTRAVLEACDFFCADCVRDIALAKEAGFHGEIFGVFPGGGGYDLDFVRLLREGTRVSLRRDIAVKGYSHSINRLDIALEALALCGADTSGRRVVVFSAGPGSDEIIEEYRPRIEGDIIALTRIPHRDFLTLLSQCRVSLGVSVSDGAANTLLEAMLLGTFPVQTDPGGASSEWIVSGLNGTLIPDDDPKAIAEAVSQALKDDSLVERAASENWNRAAPRLDRQSIAGMVAGRYETVVENRTMKMSERSLH